MMNLYFLIMFINRYIFQGVVKCFRVKPNMIWRVSSATFSGTLSSMKLTEQLLKLSESIKNQEQEDYAPLAKDYIELTQESFSQIIKSNTADPQLLLMFLSTFEDPNQIKKCLPFLYPQINHFEKKQLLLLMENILTFKPLKKPNIPFARPLEDIQPILVIFNELYPADLLIKWLEYIPVYEGSNVYVLSMGFFSISEKMSKSCKFKHEKTLQKCKQRILQLLEGQPLDVKVGVILLGLELKYEDMFTFLLDNQIDLEELDPFKVLLLLTEISKYRNTIQNTQVNQKIHKIQNQILKEVNQFNFQNTLKIQPYLALWKMINKMDTLSGKVKHLITKLTKYSTSPAFQRSIDKLTPDQHMLILQTMEKHKINHEKLLKSILVQLSPNLETLDKSLAIKLVKVLVTYVRQCQKYLVDTVELLQRRKHEFTEAQKTEINSLLGRVRVLFSKPFYP